MAYGLGKASDGGFATDSLEECRSQAIEILTLPNMVDPLDDPSRAIFVQRITDKIFQLQQVGLDLWNMMFVGTASGANLDKLAENVGLLRKPGIAQQLSVQLTSINVANGYTIPANTIFSTQDGKYTYATLTATNITVDTPVIIPVQATSVGDWPVMSGDKLISQTYIPQLTDITIESISTGGAAEESDEELRLRFLAKLLTFIGTIPFMLDKLREIDLLRKVGENHNNTSSEDSDGLPAYSTEFLVLPYPDTNLDAVKSAVAQKIISFMLPGLPTYGSTTFTVPDYRGRDRTVKFTIVDQVPLEVFFRIVPKEDGEFSDSMAPAQAEKIYDYINTQDIGTDISITTLWGIVSPDATYDIADFGIRRVGSSEWQKTNLSIGIREAASISLDNITISQNAGN